MQCQITELWIVNKNKFNGRPSELFELTPEVLNFTNVRKLICDKIKSLSHWWW